MTDKEIVQKAKRAYKEELIEKAKEEENKLVNGIKFLKTETDLESVERDGSKVRIAGHLFDCGVIFYKYPTPTTYYLIPDDLNLMDYRIFDMADLGGYFIECENYEE